MAFGKSISEGWSLFKDSLKVLRRYPVLAVPLFGSWLMIAATTLIFRYYDLSLLLVFLAIFLVAYSLTLACLMLLELMQQIESGLPPSLLMASGEMISKNAIKAMPIAFVWAVIWFVILMLRAMTREKNGGDNPDPSLQDAGQTLSGMNSGPFSWLGLGLSMLEKLVRMIVFAVLPAIAWENKGPWSAFKKGSSVVRKHPGQFLTNYGLTSAAALLMALPLLPIYILSEAEVQLPGAVWVGVIIYSGIIWTIEIYLEQMSVALLYLWHLKWERGGAQGDLSSVPKPDLLDNLYDLTTNPNPPEASTTSV